MVLENVDELSPDSFSDNPSPDQNDPYASSSGSSSPGTRFDASVLPQPLPVIGALTGNSSRDVRFKAEAMLKFADRQLGRQVYPDEAQALALHIYQLERTKSCFAACGAAAGAYRAYATMATNRYPFYQPKAESIDPTKFAFIRGPMAPMARHAFRFSLYLIVTMKMGSIVGQMIAQPLAAVNTSRDPRLEQFGHELQLSMTADNGKAGAQGPGVQLSKKEIQREVRDLRGMGPSPQGAWGKQQPPARASEDDMSPTAGSEAWATQPSGSGSWDSFSSQPDQSTPQQSEGQTSSQAWSRRAPPTSSSPFDDDDDDASPTGGMFQDEVNKGPTQQQSRPGESSWDRLRRGAAPTPAQQPRRSEPERRGQREGSTLGDSFTFVEGEQEKKQSRERAQREFDERIERERQGRDFTEGQGKRW